MKTVCPQGRVGSNPTLSVNLSYKINFIKNKNKDSQCESYIFAQEQMIGEVPKLAEGTPLERVQVVNSGARVQIPPSPLVC